MAILGLRHCSAWLSALLECPKWRTQFCCSVHVAGRPHHGGVFVLVHSMAVQIFCYIVKDGGWSTCRSVKHGGLLSLPYAFPDRFCRRDNMADLIIWISWQFVTWTSWRGFLPGTFLAGFAPGGPAALLKMAGVVVFAAKSERKVGWTVLDCRMTHPIRKGGRIGHSQLLEDGIRLCELA